MSLLTLIQQAAILIGVPKPQSVNGNNDPSVAALYEFANEEGRELAGRAEWENLTKEHSFTTVAASAQTDGLPADFDRFVKNTMFNRTTQRRVIGPISSEQWQREKSTVSPASIHNYFRVRGGQLMLTPDPAAGHTVAYEYVSKYWVTGDKKAFDTDTDVSLLPETLLVLGVRWRYKKDKGLVYDQDYITYQHEVKKAISRNGGAPNLSLGSPSISLGLPNVPEIGFGQ